MVLMKPPTGPSPSPYTYEGADYLQRRIGVIVEHDNDTRLLTAVTTYRDDGCLFGNIFFGLGENGSPNTTLTQLAVPVGAANDQLADMLALGFVTVEDVQALQVTSG